MWVCEYVLDEVNNDEFKMRQSRVIPVEYFPKDKPNNSGFELSSKNVTPATRIE